MVLNVSRSLFMRATLKPGSKSRGTMAFGMRSSALLPPLLALTTSYTIIGSSPAFTPSASPSIIASPLTQAIMLLMALMMFPAPTGPTWKMFGPIAQHGPRALEWRRVAADHDGERGRARATDAAAHGRLEEVHAARLRLRLDLPRRRGQHAAEINEDRAGPVAGHQAARIKIACLAVGRRRERRQHNLGLIDDVVRRARALGAGVE